MDTLHWRTSYSVQKMAELLSKELCKMHEQTTDHTTGHIQQEVQAVRHSQPSRQKQRFRYKQHADHAEMGQANIQPNRRGQKVLLIVTETVHSSTPSATGVTVKDTYWLCTGRLVSQPEKEKWLNTWWKNEHRISQLRCSLLPHMSKNRRFYYTSRTST